MLEACNDTYLPITDPNKIEIRAYIVGLPDFREVYFEIFCTTKISVDNPLLALSGHGGRKIFLGIEEGFLVSDERYWVEVEADSIEGFLETDKDIC